MHHFLIAILLCLSLAPWEAIGQGPPSGDGYTRDALLAPASTAVDPSAGMLAAQPPVLAAAPPGYTLIKTQPALAAVPSMPSEVVTEVPTPPPSTVVAEPWWSPLIQNGHYWAMFLTALVGLLKFLGVKKVDRYARNVGKAVEVAYHATEEAGFRGEIAKGNKAPPFQAAFSRLMEGMGHKGLPYSEVLAAQTEADARNNLERKKADAAANPSPAPSAP